MTQHKTIIEVPDVPCGACQALLGSDFPGFQPGMLYVLASLPSQDKSSFLIAAAQTGPEDVVKAQACLDACREKASGLLINFGGEKLLWSLLIHLYLHQVQAEPAQVLFARKESRMNKDKENEMPNYDELFKKFCLKQNPDEKVSGQAAFFILKFVEFLKEHGGESPADNSPEVEQPVFMQDFAPGANIEYGVRKKRRFRLERRMAKRRKDILARVNAGDPPP